MLLSSSVRVLSNFPPQRQVEADAVVEFGYMELAYAVVQTGMRTEYN
jgi:hypothetical protein